MYIKEVSNLDKKWHKTDYFQEFYFISQSQCHKIGNNRACFGL